MVNDQNNLSDIICVESEYLKESEKSEFPLKTNYKESSYINYCEEYSLEDSNLICSKCSENTIMRKDNLDCLLKESVENCFIAREKIHGFECEECMPDYSLSLSRECIKGNISNCSVYSTNTP